MRSIVQPGTLLRSKKFCFASSRLVAHPLVVHPLLGFIANNLAISTQEGFPMTTIREIKILGELDHPNIVNLKEIVTQEIGGSKKVRTSSSSDNTSDSQNDSGTPRHACFE